MKITLAYLPEELEKVGVIMAFLTHYLPGPKVHKSDAHPPYKHIYLTTKRPLETPQTVAAQGKEQKEGTPL